VSFHEAIVKKDRLIFSPFLHWAPILSTSPNRGQIVAAKSAMHQISNSSRVFRTKSVQHDLSVLDVVVGASKASWSTESAKPGHRQSLRHLSKSFCCYFVLLQVLTSSLAKCNASKTPLHNGPVKRRDGLRANCDVQVDGTAPTLCNGDCFLQRLAPSHQELFTCTMPFLSWCSPPS